MAGETVLIIDDEIKIRTILTHFLKAEGYKPEQAKTPQEGLKLAKKKKFDVILLDVMMGGMDGFEVCKKLRKSKKTKDVPVVFVTAAGDQESRERGKQSGGTMYLHKPFTKADVTKAIRVALATVEAKEE